MVSLKRSSCEQGAGNLLLGWVYWPNSDLEQGLSHNQDGTQISVVTAHLHSHLTIVAEYWSFSESPHFISAQQDLRRSARYFFHAGSQSSLLLLSKSVAPDDVLQIRICTVEKAANQFMKGASSSYLEELPREIFPIKARGKAVQSSGRLPLWRNRLGQSSSPESWKRRRKGLDSMTTNQARMLINHLLALEHRTRQAEVGSDPSLWRWQPSCVSTRPPSPRNTRSIPQIYPFSRIWLRFSIDGATCRHRASVFVTSQEWSSSSAAADFRDVIAISGYHLLWRHFFKMAAISALCHHSSSWPCLSPSHIASVSHGTLMMNFSPFSRAGLPLVIS